MEKDLIGASNVCGSHRSTYPKIVVSRWRFVGSASSDKEHDWETYLIVPKLQSLKEIYTLPIPTY